MSETVEALQLKDPPNMAWIRYGVTNHILGHLIMWSGVLMFVVSLFSLNLHQDLKLAAIFSIIPLVLIALGALHALAFAEKFYANKWFEVVEIEVEEE